MNPIPNDKPTSRFGEKLEAILEHGCLLRLILLVVVLPLCLVGIDVLFPKTKMILYLVDDNAETILKVNGKSILSESNSKQSQGKKVRILMVSRAKPPYRIELFKNGIRKDILTTDGGQVVVNASSEQWIAAIEVDYGNIESVDHWKLWGIPKPKVEPTYRIPRSGVGIYQLGEYVGEHRVFDFETSPPDSIETTSRLSRNETCVNLVYGN